MATKTYPIMNAEQWRTLLDAVDTVADQMRVHLGAESPEWRALNAALELGVLELERRCEARRPQF